jgi:glyoxylase-like metal-dependent hydrolase (beta-lactamase superfamily II)
LIPEWDKQSEKFFGYYSLWGSHSMDKSLAKYGFSRDDITDVFMTHLHFDHCGGSAMEQGQNRLRTSFQKRQILV